MSDNPFRLTGTALRLYEQAAKDAPIYDYHCHLSPKELYEDKPFEDIADVLLGGDHYKWRAMRYDGVPESHVTGNAPRFEKFEAWMQTCEHLIGSPLYHWSVLEMKLFFGIELAPCKENAKEIYTRCNEQIRARALSPRKLLTQCNVRLVCTTDDPADDLAYHGKLRADKALPFAVIPAFRPDKALKLAAPDFVPYIQSLSEAAGMRIGSYADLLAALEKRLDFFVEMGCRFSDHSLESVGALAAPDEAAAVFEARMAGETISDAHCDRFRMYTLQKLGELYRRRSIVMQLHIGAMRNVNTTAFQKLGPDAGYDIANDFPLAPQLAALLDAIEQHGGCPKMVLYTLNSKDYNILAELPHCFTEAGVRGKVQLGSAWWHHDTQAGMYQQLQYAADFGLLASFVGMLTDSRSFLSFARHDYFRRILCSFVGNMKDSGDYWGDDAALFALVEGVCYKNIERFMS